MGEEGREKGRGGIADRTACHFTNTIYISPPIYLFVINYNVNLNPRRHYEGLVTQVYLKNILMAQVITYFKRAVVCLCVYVFNLRY